MPDVGAAKGKAIAFQTHGFIGDGASQDHQVGPGDLVAVFLLDRPEQATGLIEADIVGPAVERCKALVAGAATAAPIGQTVGPSGMPGHADHQAAIVTPICRPPVLAIGHQGMEVFLDGLMIECLDFFAIVKVRSHRIGLGVMLMQDVKLEGIGPPIHDRFVARGVATMHDRAFAGAVHFISAHKSPPNMWFGVCFARHCLIC